MNYKDMTSGAVFLAIGGFFAISALTGLRVGSLVSMGPGYFPLVVGILLSGLGALIGIRAFASPHSPIEAVAWRAVILISLGLAFFGLSVRGLGFVPAMIGLTLASALAASDMTWRRALVTSAALTVFCVGLFVYALRLQLPLLSPWFLAQIGR